MLKRRPVVASAVGGITEQITHGRHGLLIDNPADLAAFSQSVLALLRDPSLRARLARTAHDKCQAEFLADRELTDYARLYASMAK